MTIKLFPLLAIILAMVVLAGTAWPFADVAKDLAVIGLLLGVEELLTR